MLIDWKNPPTLPRIAKPVRDVGELGRAKMKRRKKKGSKAHATAKDISVIARRKAAQAKKELVTRNATFREYKNAVRAFWVGDVQSHPRRPQRR